MKNIIMQIGLIMLLGTLLTSNLQAQKTNTFKDPRDGKIYKIVKIGDQIWFAENLAYKVEADTLKEEYDLRHVNKFGRLYVYSDVAEACPPGWHLPSKEECEILLNNVGGSGSEAYKQLILGGSSGFDVLFGGWRLYGGYDGNTGKYAYYWTSTKDTPGRIWTLNFYGINERAEMYRNYFQGAYSTNYGEYVGYPIRCIKDK